MLYVAVSGLYVGAEKLTLRFLSNQTSKDFKVIFIDPELDETIPEKLLGWQKEAGVEVIRAPYRSAPGGRVLDWAQWNTPVLLAESEQDMIFRLQSFRMIPSNLIEMLLQWDRNVIFPRHVVSATPAEALAYSEQPASARRQEQQTIDGAAGDWCLRVSDLLKLNGVDEPLTMLFHFEDVDMEYRYRTALRLGQIGGWVYSLPEVMQYISNQSRLLFNDPELTTGKYHIRRTDFANKLCGYCQQQWGEQLQTSNDPGIQKEQIPGGESLKDCGVHFGKRWFVCQTCNAPIAHYGKPHYTVNHYGDEYRATIGLDGQWGRNLRVAREKAQALGFWDRLAYVRDSYTDKEVLCG